LNATIEPVSPISLMMVPLKTSPATFASTGIIIPTIVVTDWPGVLPDSVKVSHVGGSLIWHRSRFILNLERERVAPARW